MTRPALNWHARQITCTEWMISAALACTEVAADLSAAHVTDIGRYDLLAALERLSVTHHNGTTADIEAAARDVSIAVHAVHVPANDVRRSSRSAARPWISAAGSGNSMRPPQRHGTAISRPVRSDHR
jgi:hypothetical protein